MNQVTKKLVISLLLLCIVLITLTIINGSNTLTSNSKISFENFDYKEDIDLLENHLINDHVQLPKGINIKIELIKLHVDNDSTDLLSSTRLKYSIRLENGTDIPKDMRYIMVYPSNFTKKYMYSGTYIKTPLRNIESNKGFNFTIDEIVADFYTLTKKEQIEYQDMMRKLIFIIEVDEKQFIVEESYEGSIDGIIK
jgi:hypothetical protein